MAPFRSIEAKRACQRKWYAKNREEINAGRGKWRANNLEKLAAYQRKYRADNRGELSARGKKYYAGNREKIAAQQRKYRGDNWEKIAAYGRKYCADNPGRVLASRRKRYAESSGKRVVYFILIRAILILKVGHTTGIKQRMEIMQTGNPLLLELLLTVPGGCVEERRLHDLFVRYHVRGEWYEYSDDIGNFIEGLRRGIGG